MLAPLRGQQLKNYVTGIRNQLNSEKLAEKKRAYNEAITKYELCLYLISCQVLFICFCVSLSEFELVSVVHILTNVSFLVNLCFLQGKGTKGAFIRGASQGSGG